MTQVSTTYQEVFSRIIDLLQQHTPRGISILKIARELDIDRKTAAKYLELLTLSGDVSVERFGQKKFYQPSRRIPLPEIFDHLHHAIVILDSNLQILMVNTSFIVTLGIHPGHNLVGVPLFDLDLPVFSELSVRRNIERVQQSQMYLPEMQLIDERTNQVYLVDFAPIVSQTSRPGIMVSLRDITELRKAETDLKDSEKKMATLFESVPSGIIIFSADGTILNANRATLRVLGLRTLAELRNANVFDIVCRRERMESLIRLGQEAETELACDFDRLLRKQQIQGTKHGVAFFDMAFTPIPSGTRGPPNEYAILFKDITTKRRAEKELKERYKGITSNLPGIAYQFYARDTGEWGVYYVDERSMEIYGLPIAPLETWFQRFGACIAPEDQARWFESIRDVIARVAPWDFEGCFIRSTGEEMFIRGVSQPVRLKNKTVWNGIFLNITERKQAEEALQTSVFQETRYRSFFEDTCNGVLIYEPINGGNEYVIKDVNRATAFLLRMEKQDLIGKRLFREFPDLPDPSVREMLIRVLTTEQPEFVPPLRYRNRDDFPWISHYVFKLPSGELASFMIDVSEVLEDMTGSPERAGDAGCDS